MSEIHPLDEETGATQETTVDEPAPTELIEEELLVEEVSVDGMCGVY